MTYFLLRILLKYKVNAKHEAIYGYICTKCTVECRLCRALPK